MEKENMVEVNPRLNSATGGLTFSVATVIYLALSLIVSFAVSAIVNGVMQKYGYADYAEAFEHVQKTDAYVYVSYLIAPVAIAISVFAVLKYKKINIRNIVPVKCRYKYYIIAVLLIYGLLFSLSWVNDVSVKFFKLFGYEQREAASYFPDLSGAKIIPALLVMAVLPAVMEELLFRGAILNGTVNGAGSIRTIFIVGFCFSLFHGSPEQTVYQFIAGCAFAFIAVRSGSILPSVLMHFINNALIVILSACNCFDEAGNLIISSGGNIALIVTSAVALVGALVWLILDKTPLKKCEKGGVKTFFLYGAVGIAAFGLIWILSLFGVA